MSTVIIVIHLMVVVAMIGLVLLQRSEGGALGIGGGGSGAFMSGRGAANMLTRTTGILAATFFVTSVVLTLLARLESGPTDIFQNLPGVSVPATQETQPAIPPSGGSAQDMLKQLENASGPQTPPDASSENAPAASDDASAPADGESPSDTSSSGEALPTPEGGAVPSLDGGAGPQTPPADAQ